MNKKWWCTGILALIVVLGTACGDKPQAQPIVEQSETVNEPKENAPTTNASGGVNSTEGDQETTPVPAETTPVPAETTPVPTETPAVSSHKEEIAVYFTDPQAMELKESQQEITFEDDLQKYKSAFKALQNSGNPELISLWEKIELLSLDFKEGAITIDINMPDEARLGSGGEMFALEALQNTLFQFDEVKSIELLVNGAEVESLMGHVELEHPMMKK
jgi:spore germination protein GerM